MSEQWKLKIYLAGYSNDLEYRRITIEKYGHLIDFVDPMTITWTDVNSNVSKNVNYIWLIKRDKKLIDQCDILVAKIEYLPYGQIMIGTLMEVMYAFEHGIPVFLISESDYIRNNAWLKFHYEKVFSGIEECFDYITSSQDIPKTPIPPPKRIIMEDTGKQLFTALKPANGLREHPNYEIIQEDDNYVYYKKIGWFKKMKRTLS